MDEISANIVSCYSDFGKFGNSEHRYIVEASLGNMANSMNHHSSLLVLNSYLTFSYLSIKLGTFCYAHILGCRLSKVNKRPTLKPIIMINQVPVPTYLSHLLMHFVWMHSRKFTIRMQSRSLLQVSSIASRQKLKHQGLVRKTPASSTQTLPMAHLKSTDFVYPERRQEEIISGSQTYS